MKKKTILLIEDSQDDIAFTQRAIDTNGHDVNLVKATNGQDALDLLFQDGKYREKRVPHIDLILLDINIPVINGLEVLKQIRNNDMFDMIPIVVFSSSQNQNDLYRAGELGANSYVVKPLSYKGYKKAIQQITSYWFDVNTPAFA